MDLPFGKLSAKTVSVISKSLSGKRIAVTGSTGFLGTALVERLLRSVPDCELVLLVRPSRRNSAERRVQREIFRNDAFDTLRSQWGDDFDEICERRVSVISGDGTSEGLGLNEAEQQLFA